MLAMNATPWLESRWTAPSTGTYSLTTEYETEGVYIQDSFNDTDDDVRISGTTAINAATMDSVQTVVKEISHADFSKSNTQFVQTVAEQLFEFLATNLVAPYFGPIGKIMANFLIEFVVGIIEALVDVEKWYYRNIFGGPATNQVQYRFTAEEGKTYRFRFSTPGCFTGKSLSYNAGFRAGISTDYSLTKFEIVQEEIGECDNSGIVPGDEYYTHTHEHGGFHHGYIHIGSHTHEHCHEET